MEAIQIKTTQLIMTSLTVDSTTETSTQLSRDFDFDDDEE